LANNSSVRSVNTRQQREVPLINILNPYIWAKSSNVQIVNIRQHRNIA
jgi:hypothetical protein